MKEKFMTKITLKQVHSLEDLTDWKRIEQMSETDIEENALSDEDNKPIDLSLKGLKRINRSNSKIKSNGSTKTEKTDESLMNRDTDNVILD